MLNSDIKKINECISVLEIHNSNELALDDIKRHYRKLVHKYHPDSAEEQYRDGKKFIELKDAYDWLTVPEHLALLPDFCNIYNQFDKITTEKKPDLFTRRKYDTYSATKKQKSFYPAEEVDGRPYNLEKCIWEPVSSNNIKYVYYDSYREYLFVIFNTSQNIVYCYKAVPYKIYHDFMHASSLGAYLNTFIKPSFKCVKMSRVISDSELNS